MILAALAMVAFDVVPPPQADPLKIDVAAAIECGGNSDDLFTLLVLRSNRQDFGAKRNWTGIEAPNRFFAYNPYFPTRFRLPAPIEVFGRKTDELAFTNNTIFAVVKGADPKALATELKIKADIDDGETFMGGRVARREVQLDPEDGSKLRIMLAHQITTIGEPAGQILVGCSHVFEAEK